MDETTFLKASAYECSNICFDQQMNPMFKVKKFDYLEPIKRLEKYYKGSNYYNTLLETVKIVGSPLETTDHNYETDEIILQYIKCFPNMRCIVLWPAANVHTKLKTTKFYSKLMNNGTVHAIKHFDATTKQLQGIIYQLNYNNKDFKQFNTIKDKQLKCCDKKRNSLIIIFFEPNFFESVSLTKEELQSFHRELEFELGETLIPQKGVHRPLQFSIIDNYIFMTKNFNETVDSTKLFCNKNSIRLLDYQRLDLITHRNYDKCNKLFYTYKNWLYTEIEQIDQIRFLVFSSCVLYALGIRGCNDIDLIVHNKSTDDIMTYKYYEKIKYYLEDPNTRFESVDTHIEGRGAWTIGGEKERLFDWFNKEWPVLYGAKSMDDTVLNPMHHFYYFGIKIISMKADIKRRLKRERPAAFADLIALNKLTNANIKLEPLSKGYWKNAEYFEFTDYEIKDLYKKIVWYLRSRYSINLSIDDVKKLVKS